MTENKQLQYKLHPEAAHRSVAGEVFVVTADRAFHRMQSPTAHAIYEILAAGPATAAQLSEMVHSRYAVAPSVANRDVAAFLSVLVERGLAVAETSAPPAAVDSTIAVNSPGFARSGEAEDKVPT